MYEITPGWAAIIGGVCGSFITGGLAYLTNAVNKRSEERKHLATLTTNAAIEHWKRLHEGRQGEDIMPLDVYLIHMAKLTQEILNSKITKKNVAAKLRDIDEIVSEMQKYAESVKPKATDN
jgi:hypothetical protein